VSSKTTWSPILKLVERPVVVSIQFLVEVSQTLFMLPTQRTFLGTPVFKVTRIESTEAPMTTLSPPVPHHSSQSYLA